MSKNIMWKRKVTPIVREDLIGQLDHEFNKRNKYKDYHEVAIMFDPKKIKFFLAPTFDIDKLEYEGNEFCQVFDWTKADGKLKYNNIKDNLFKELNGDV